jgi:hypothetical protein
MPEIYVIGDLVEGNTVEIVADFTGDALSFKHTKKHWDVYAEKNLKYDMGTLVYYYEENDGTIFTANDADNVQVKNITPGRLFACFTYIDYITNVSQRYVKVFTVLPKTTISIPSDITQNGSGEFSVTTTVNNANVLWTFSDDSTSISGATVSRTCLYDGYFTATTEVDYSFSTYQNNDPIVWGCVFPDKLANISVGFLGNGTPFDSFGFSLSGQASYSLTSESIANQYLVKYDLLSSIALNLSLSKGNENNSYAPLKVYFTDSSVYSLTTDSSAANRIDYIELVCGDGEVIKSTDLNFTREKVYQRSGTFNGSYSVYTSHTTSGGPDYTQTILSEFSITVDPFFTWWFREHFPKNIYNSNQFNDLAQAWGLQMDRLYNETQILVDSIDTEKINSKFMRSLAATYGDFPDIYEKVGFSGFVDSLDDKFKYFVDYNIFDKIAKNELGIKEKQEFIEYIRSAKDRLTQKGTPISIERAVAQFLLTAKVIELWTDSFTPAEFGPIKDEVFTGNAEENNTGLKYTCVSTPSSDNMSQVIVNSSKNSYIEINTINRNSISYYTDSNETEKRNGVEYVVFEI